MLSSLPIPSKYYTPILEICNNSSLYLYALISACAELKRKFILKIPGKKEVNNKKTDFQAEYPKKDRKAKIHTKDRCETMETRRSSGSSEGNLEMGNTVSVRPTFN